jgi:cysteine-S-conjugate beta-lyase
MDITADPLEVLRTRTSEKWRTYPDDVLPLFVAEMDYPLAPPIADALIAAVRRSDTGYAGPGDDLQRAFAGFAERRWGWRVDPAQVTTTTDVSVVIVEALRKAIRPGDGVIITPPVYPPFFDFIPEAGGRVIEVPLRFEGPAGRGAATAWSLDLAGIEAALAAGARAILLCNPHNPLGLVHSREELAAVAEAAARFGAIVVSDEIHAPLVHSDARFTPYLSVSDAARRNGIAAHAASKAWNLAGLKCAMFVTAGDAMSALVGSMPDEVAVRTSLFGRIASTTAYRDGGEWLEDLLRSLESNRRRLTGQLAAELPSVVFDEPQASYLAWLDFRSLGWGDDPSARILDEARVAVNPGLTFGSEGAGFVRLNFACSPELLDEAIARVSAVSRGSSGQRRY